MQDSAAEAAVTDRNAGAARGGDASSGPKPRIVAATAMPIASSVITVSAPFATERSARSKVTSRTSAKKPAAASVSHIGKAGERQISSSDDGQAQFMRDVLGAGKARLRGPRPACPQADAVCVNLKATRALVLSLGRAVHRKRLPAPTGSTDGELA